MMYMGYYNGGARVVDVSGELRGDLYRQGREIARLWTGDPKGWRPESAVLLGRAAAQGPDLFQRHQQRDLDHETAKAGEAHADEHVAVASANVDPAGLRRHLRGGGDRQVGEIDRDHGTGFGTDAFTRDEGKAIVRTDRHAVHGAAGRCKTRAFATSRQIENRR